MSVCVRCRVQKVREARRIYNRQSLEEIWQPVRPPDIDIDGLNDNESTKKSFRAARRRTKRSCPSRGPLLLLSIMLIMDIIVARVALNACYNCFVGGAESVSVNDLYALVISVGIVTIMITEKVNWQFSRV